MRARLTKKSRGYYSSNPVVAAQNVMMRKLGMLKENSEPDVVAIQEYASWLCANELSDSNAKAIDELFPNCFQDAEEDNVELEEWA